VAVGAPLRFVKGHGTENDFVLLPDPDGAGPLTPELVRALCDRRAGIGGDGVLRVVRSRAEPDAAGLDAEWFMDYRNADGSVAEMCGNGIRVFGRYLVSAGLAAPGRIPVATRSGVRLLTVPPTGDVTVDMGPPVALGPSQAVVAGRTLAGIGVSMGNPHLVVIVDDALDSYDLGATPVVPAADFPDGVNVELVRRAGNRAIEMRVHERGVGETRSCGTGICAAAYAVATSAGEASGRWTVEVPGGRAWVDLVDDTSLLTGPAVLVAAGELDAEWLGEALRATVQA
jgi:diaminopimelate epimerase